MSRLMTSSGGPGCLLHCAARVLPVAYSSPPALVGEATSAATDRYVHKGWARPRHAVVTSPVTFREGTERVARQYSLVLNPHLWRDSEPSTARTQGERRIRKPMLYPTELRGRLSACYQRHRSYGDGGGEHRFPVASHVTSRVTFREGTHRVGIGSSSGRVA